MSTDIKQWAPVGLFIYKRPEHTRRAIVSLQACDGAQSSPLYVFADGPKTEAEVPAVQATRTIARELLGRSAVFVEQERNRGLANSIIAGMTKLCDQYGTVIAVEEDLVLARSFLRFLNEGLERYLDQPQVMQVSGHIVDVPPSFAHRGEAPASSSHSARGPRRPGNAPATFFHPAAIGWRERPVHRARMQAIQTLVGGQRRMFACSRTDERGDRLLAIRWDHTVAGRRRPSPPSTADPGAVRGFDGSCTLRRIVLGTQISRVQREMGLLDAEPRAL